ncbi:hypothetical protein [Fulvivirga sp.]|uniref:hypothetical protein n=1 Tax=Fulvivirga sp. TaxID=1931237 RepID=UPI0032EFFFD5
MSDTRAFVINYGVMLEAEANFTLSAILNIELDSSKALGDSYQSLGFNQKITLIQDLKGLNKDTINKLQKFMEIRNKFAHVLKIDSFSAFKTKTQEGKATITKLENWYLNKISDKIKISKNKEEDYRNLFLELYKDIWQFLQHTKDVHLVEKHREQSISYLQLGLLEILKQKLSASNELAKILENAESEMKEKWEEKKRRDGFRVPNKGFHE